MSELELIRQVVVKKGEIKFEQFKSLKEQAEKVAEVIRSVDDSEENMGEAKKILASSRKSIKALNDKRIEIKKEYSKPLVEFENKIKEIEKIINDADKELNGVIKAHEASQRDLKLELIKSMYKFNVVPRVSEVASFDWFFESHFLNKTFSMNKIEKEFEEFNQKILSELETIEKMGNGEDVMIEYISTKGNFIVSLDRVNEREKLKREAVRVVDKPVEKVVDKPVEKQVFTFRVEGEFNANLVKQLMEKHEIYYKEL